MANSTNITLDLPPEWLVTVVGSSYLIIGVVFIFLQVVCAYLMRTDKDMQYATYRFMINVSFTDALELLGIAIYAGVSILLDSQNEILGLIMGSWILSLWYAQCVLFIFIAVSRWISLTRPHLAPRIFKKHVELTMQILPHVVFTFAYAASTIYMLPSRMFYFVPMVFTWTFGRDHPLGEYLYWHNFVFNSMCAFIEAGFNIMSLMWVHQTRKTVLTFEAVQNRRREVKLLIQCCIIGTIFFVASTLYTIVFAWAGKETMIWCLLMQLVWTANHCINPIVYLWVNKRLRKRFWQWITCSKNKVADSTTHKDPTGTDGSRMGDMKTQ